MCPSLTGSEIEIHLLEWYFFKIWIKWRVNGRKDQSKAFEYVPSQSVGGLMNLIKYLIKFIEDETSILERRKPILKEEERVHKVKIIQSGHQRGNRNIFPSRILVSNLSPSFCCPELPFLPLLRKVRLARISSNTAIDSTPKREPSDTLPITVNLRVREKLIPRGEDRNFSMHMQNVSPLIPRSFWRHVQVQAS